MRIVATTIKSSSAATTTTTNVYNMSVVGTYPDSFWLLSNISTERRKKIQDVYLRAFWISMWSPERAIYTVMMMMMMMMMLMGPF
jgi:hypothetical protein